MGVEMIIAILLCVLLMGTGGGFYVKRKVSGNYLPHQKNFSRMLQIEPQHVPSSSLTAQVIDVTAKSMAKKDAQYAISQADSPADEEAPALEEKPAPEEEKRGVLLRWRSGSSKDEEKDSEHDSTPERQETPSVLENYNREELNFLKVCYEHYCDTVYSSHVNSLTEGNFEDTRNQQIRRMRKYREALNELLSDEQDEYAEEFAALEEMTEPEYDQTDRR